MLYEFEPAVVSIVFSRDVESIRTTSEPVHVVPNTFRELRFGCFAHKGEHIVNSSPGVFSEDKNVGKDAEGVDVEFEEIRHVSRRVFCIFRGE